MKIHWPKAVLLAIILVTFMGCATTKEYPQFPWITWGEVSQTVSGKDNSGLKVDGYLEQGIDWFRIGKKGPIFNTFAGLRFVASNKSDYWWDNKVGPWFGAKLKLPVTPYKGAWGEVSLGIRGEYYTYFSTARYRPYANDLRCLIFLQWSFGGKW